MPAKRQSRAYTKTPIDPNTRRIGVAINISNPSARNPDGRSAEHADDIANLRYCCGEIALGEERDPDAASINIVLMLRPMISTRWTTAFKSRRSWATWISWASPAVLQSPVRGDWAQYGRRRWPGAARSVALGRCDAAVRWWDRDNDDSRRVPCPRRCLWRAAGLRCGRIGITVAGRLRWMHPRIGSIRNVIGLRCSSFHRLIDHLDREDQQQPLKDQLEIGAAHLPPMRAPICAPTSTPSAVGMAMFGSSKPR